MKKIILSLAVVFIMSSFTTVKTDVEKINIETPTIVTVDPHMIFDSCGGSILIDDNGMTQEEIFDFAEFMDWLNCEGGLEFINII